MTQFNKMNLTLLRLCYNTSRTCISAGGVVGFLFLIGEGKPYLAKAPLSQRRHMKMAKQQPTVVPPMQNPLQRN